MKQMLQKVKLSLYLIICLLTPNYLNAQANQFGWVQQLGSTEVESVSGIAHDAEGNVYVTGSIKGDVTVTLVDNTEVNLVNNGGFDVFIAKINQNGQYVWVKNIGGAETTPTTGTDVGQKIKVDSEGNILVTGQFVGLNINFNPGGTAQLLSSGGTTDAFILKLTNTGEFLWVKKIGSTGGEYAYAMDIDNQDNVYIGGRFQREVDFDPGVGEYKLTANSDLSGAASFDAYVLKLNKNGDFVWAKSFGGKGWDVVNGLAVDVNQNVYLTGRFDNEANFNPDPLGTPHKVTASYQDAFILKLDMNGEFVWNRIMFSNGAANDVWGNEIAVDKKGNVFVTGFFTGTTKFSSATAEIVSGGSRDIFVLKTNTNGDLSWLKGIGSTSDDRGEGITIDGNGDVYVIGKFAQNNVDFGNGVKLSVGGQFDAFLMKIKSDGTTQWAERFGGTTAELGVAATTDLGYAVSVDLDGNIYSTGTFSGSAIFDFPDKNNKLTTIGAADVFITKIAQVGFVLPVELVRFYLEETSAGNKLVWETASEKNNSHFELEKSLDGLTFNFIKRIEGNKTTSSFNRYTYLDTDVNFEELAYYRLKQVDFNGNTSYSALTTSKRKSVNTFKVYPNPVVENLTIKSNQTLTGATLKIVNSLGKTIYVNKQVNGNEINIDMSAAPHGMYILKMQNKDQVVTYKFLK